VFFTSTLYLAVTQPAGVLTKPLVTVAELGASVDVTVTLLDETCVPLKVEVVLRVEWPDAFTVSVTVASSPCGAVKVHSWVAPGAIDPCVPQLTLVAVLFRLLGTPAAHAANTRAGGVAVFIRLSS